MIANSDFSKKLISVQVEGLLGSKLIGKIFDLNKLRVIFSHHSAYQEEIREYGDNLDKQLQALKLLDEVYEGLNEVFAKSMGMSKKQREEFEKSGLG